MKRVNIKHIFKKLVKTYIVFAALIGTIVLSFPVIYPIILIVYNSMAPAPLPVLLPNGFIYDNDSQRDGMYYAIYDKEWHVEGRKSIVMSNVRDVMWHGNTIYGFRQGLANEPYYYICTFGENCTKTQHLSEIDFKRILTEKGLPAYNSRKAQTYDQLLWEQSKTYKGKGG